MSILFWVTITSLVVVAIIMLVQIVRIIMGYVSEFKACRQLMYDITTEIPECQNDVELKVQLIDEYSNLVNAEFHAQLDDAGKFPGVEAAIEMYFASWYQAKEKFNWRHQILSNIRW